MGFDHKVYLNRFLLEFTAGIFSNDSVAKVTRVTNEGPHYQIIGVHHLTPDENRGNHHLYISVVDSTGKRNQELVEWGWVGQTPQQIVRPVVLDKPPNEPDGNIGMGQGQIVWAKVLGKLSDTISNCTTLLPDEGPNNWNSIGHHSYYVVFMWNEGTTVPPEPSSDEIARLKAELLTCQTKYNKLVEEIKKLIGEN